MAIQKHFVLKSDGSVHVSKELSRETKWSELEAEIYANIVDPGSTPERVCNFCILYDPVLFRKAEGMPP